MISWVEEESSNVTICRGKLLEKRGQQSAVVNWQRDMKITEEFCGKGDKPTAMPAILAMSWSKWDANGQRSYVSTPTPLTCNARGLLLGRAWWFSLQRLWAEIWAGCFLSSVTTILLVQLLGWLYIPFFPWQCYCLSYMDWLRYFCQKFSQYMNLITSIFSG